MSSTENTEKSRDLPPTRIFVDEFDRQKRERQAFEKEYKRQTYLVRRELVKKLDALCEKRPGFKTKFINYALLRCLNELEETPLTSLDTPSTRTTPSAQKTELRKEQVEGLLDSALLRCPLDDDDKNSVVSQVMKQLFPNNSEQTNLRKGERFQSPAVKAGRGYRYYASVVECVESLIEYWIKKAASSSENLADDESSYG